MPDESTPHLFIYAEGLSKIMMIIINWSPDPVSNPSFLEQEAGVVTA
jgi:hypothetical protein